MRNNHENEFFNSDYHRGLGNNDHYENRRQPDNHNRDWTNRAGDEVRSWFGDDEAERRRQMEERNDYNAGNARNYRQTEYYGGANPSGNYSSAYDRNYGTSSAAHLVHDYHRSYRSREYDPLRSVYGGPGDSMRGYGHESRRDFTTGNWQDNNRGMGNNYRSDNRDWTERTGDEVRSWFGDEDAERRRRRDEMRDNRDDWGRDQSWHERERGFSRW